MSTHMIEAPDLSSDPTVVALRPALGSKALIIKTPDDYECAAEVLKMVKSSIDTIETARVKITGPLNQALKAANEQARQAKASYLEEERIIKTAMIAYDDIQEEARLEEQRRANAAAKAEQDRLQAIADVAREKTEADARRLREAAQEAVARGAAAEAEKLLGRADTVESKGFAKVDDFECRASSVVAVVSDRQAPRVAGIVIPKVWDFRVTDESKIPREYFDRSDTRIRKVVQALKGLCNIPGIEVFQTKRMSAGKG